MLDWSPILQNVIETVISLLLPVILGFVVVWLRGLIAQGKAKLTAEQLAMAQAFVAAFVKAAEQSGLTGQLANVGEAKKQWVIAQVQSALEAKGINIDVEVISGLIEAEVYEAWGDIFEERAIAAG